MASSSSTSDPRDTPAMRQYARFKERHPECLLLFRIGDFYEMFDDDAVRASKAIGLTLTQRTAGIPMAGVPYHQLENYLRKFLAAGFRVAVCEQVQDAAEAKGLIERAVTRVLTPGTLVDETLLEDDRANHIAAVCFPPGDGPPAPSPIPSPPPAPSPSAPTLDGEPPPEPVASAAVAIIELSTGAFTVLRCGPAEVVDELARRGVSELLFPETGDGKTPPRIESLLRGLNLAGTPRPQWHFRLAEATGALRELFGVATLAGFGFQDGEAVLAPAGALVRYLQATQSPGAEADAAPGAARSPGSGPPRRPLAHLQPPRREQTGDRLLLEASTLRSLEVDRTIRATWSMAGAAGSGASDGSLLGVFNAAGNAGKGACRTAMGKRLLRDWLCRPSSRLDEIRRRHAAVGSLAEDRRFAGEVGAALAGVQDVPRIAGRIALGRATPRDLVALGASLGRCAALEAALAELAAFAPYRGRLGGVRGLVDPLARAIADACVDTPPAHLREGGLVRPGFDAALDEARTLQTDAGSWLAAYQKRLIDEHQLASLKVGYNKVFGYFIELPKGQAARAPASFARRQTLTSAERYITPELKDFEDKVTTATARAVQREQQIFAELCARAAKVLPALAAFAETVAELDVLAAFADKAVARRWVRPEVVDTPVLRVKQGRHPVLDEVLAGNFVPNDTTLGDSPAPAGAPSPQPPADADAGPAATLALITGPNMAGKSTFIRQTALLVLLAHAGSFVPAEAALIGLTDRIFTRVGADDALHAGQSTFMVEMTETASILHHATPRSLVVLDEIGRGTSTLDGLSLAWAIAETLAAAPTPTSTPPTRARVKSPAPQSGSPAARGPRTLFATHYHELTQLEELLPGRVCNLHVSVREWGDQIVFLHRILPGRTDRSYGLHVAKLAGIPGATIARAREVLASLSVEHEGAGRQRPAEPPRRDDPQLSLFKEYVPHPAVDALREVKLESLSPMQAFDELRRLKALTDSGPLA